MIYQKLLKLIPSALLHSTGISNPASLVPDDYRFNWSAIAPSEELIYHDCFEKFKCARLQVPMDWNNADPENNKTVEIAIIKVEATVPVTDPTYGGPVVLNPGMFYLLISWTRLTEYRWTRRLRSATGPQWRPCSADYTQCRAKQRQRYSTKL